MTDMSSSHYVAKDSFRALDIAEETILYSNSPKLSKTTKYLILKINWLRVKSNLCCYCCVSLMTVHVLQTKFQILAVYFWSNQK